MRVAVCDDEKKCIEKVISLLERKKEITKIDCYDDVESLIWAVEEGHKYDILFMDIVLRGKTLTGIEYASHINNILPFLQVIFITGYNKYSQDIFLKRLNLCGFLLKPISNDRFEVVYEKAVENAAIAKNSCIVISNKKGTYSIAYRQIKYIESSGHKVLFHIGDEILEDYEKIDETMKLLPSNFFQCHKSYVINMDEVTKVEGYSIEMVGGISIPISRSRLAKTKAAFFEYTKNTYMRG